MKNMKKLNNKKGFTIVELVIVIAVIAILAAVLIPTFSGVVKRANETAALEKANGARTALLVAKTGELADSYFAVVSGDEVYWYSYEKGDLKKIEAPALPTYSVNDIVYASESLLDASKAVQAGSYSEKLSSVLGNFMKDTSNTFYTLKGAKVDFIDDVASDVIVFPKTATPAMVAANP